MKKHRTYSQSKTPEIVTNLHEAYPPAGWEAASLEFKIWESSFQCPTLHLAVIRFAEDKYCVRRAIWSHSTDFESGMANEKLSLSEMEIPEEVVRKLKAKLESISIFVGSKGSIGLDGSRTGIEITSFSPNLKLDWWSSPPKGWEQLSHWCHITRQILEYHLPDTPEDFSYGYCVRLTEENIMGLLETL